MIPGYKIRHISVEPGLVLAPMSGVTTCSFRQLIKECNPGCVGLLVSEFISVEALTRKVPKSLQMMRFKESERPFGIQIFGYDVWRMADAARMVQDSGADFVDINCGCPAPKVVKKGGGCELMRQPEHLAEMIRGVRKAVSIPLTLKMRSGWQETARNAVAIARIAEQEGVEALAVHGRTRVQMYRGDADWNAVREVAEAVKIPVCGSGDIVDAGSARARFDFGAAGYFIGRGALADPFVFTEIVKGPQGLRKNEARMIQVTRRYIELMREEFTDQTICGKVKQFASQACRGFTWRKELCLAPSLTEQFEILARAEEKAALSHISSPVLANGDAQSPSGLSC